MGVVLATSGPGATNLVTGLADALIDSTPLVCITGQVFAHLLGTDAFQETDIINITTPVTKWNYQVTRAEEIPEALAKAFYIARSGRPGPGAGGHYQERAACRLSTRPSTGRARTSAATGPRRWCAQGVRGAGGGAG
ncbi:MAG: thiamine pyrophosphate-binding protein [Hymenobacter sp.]